MKKLLFIIILLHSSKSFPSDNNDYLKTEVNYFDTGILLKYLFNQPLPDDFLSTNKTNCQKASDSDRVTCDNIAKTNYDFYQKNIVYYNQKENKIIGVQYSGEYNIDCEKYYSIWDKNILQNKNFSKKEMYLSSKPSNSKSSSDLVNIEYKNINTKDTITVMCLYSSYINASHVYLLLLSSDFLEEK